MRIERFLFLDIVFSVFIGLLVGTSSGGDARKTLCLDSERQALLKFKQGLIDNYGILSSWGREEEIKECCSWKGVKCSNRTGHVEVLDVHTPDLEPKYLYTDLYLRGNMTPSLLDLQHLKYLNLSYIDFGGSRIPDFIGFFPRLEYLHIREANLSGEIPESLGNLTHLQILDLSLNFGLVVKNLEWLPRLTFLDDLDLYMVRIESVYWLQHIIESPSLEKLNLGACDLPDPIISSFHLSSNISSRLLSSLDLPFNDLSSSVFQWLFNISMRLTAIDLSSNNIAGRIPEAFGYMKNLEVIDLAANDLEGGLPKSFGNLSHLKTLYLSLNNLNQPLSELLLSLSGKAQKSLEELGLSTNHLSGSLPDITRFSSLRSLALQENQLNGSFLESNGQTSKIEFLDLSENQIIGSLPNFTIFSALKELHLNNNQFKGRLPQSIGQLSKLEILEVNSNFLEGPITESHLSNLSNLKELDLSYNKFSFQLEPNWLPPFELDVIRLSHCQMGQHFPQWLRTQKSYSDLDISFAGISDVAPNWFWDLSPKLGYFNISNNQISGEIPDLSSKFVASKDSGFPRMDFSSNNFSGLVPSFPSNLTSLHLSKNRFVGSTSFLCKLANPWFSSIDLSNNRLTGELPTCWKGFEELVILNLANNNLHGKVPSSIGSLLSIESLQLRNNYFTGALPTSLKNCKMLKILDVGGNKLSGEIPLWIGSHLTSLVVLSLRVNRFNGSIHPNLCHLNRVHILDLSQNSLSGEIPRCLNNITSLLQKNSSSSSIIFDFVAYDGSYYPGGEYMGDALVQWKSTEAVYNKTLGLFKSIDFSGNKLVGRVPEQIAQLEGLVSLNLSRNHLTGNIIEGIGKIENLESLDLSENHLTGRIPTSLAQLHFLSVLDLSSNNLSGRIPSSTQLQSFDPSSYAGNNELCGLPLEKCPEDRHTQSPFADHNNLDDEDDKFLSTDFYVSLAIGFILGFWGVIFTLIFKRSSRDSYVTNVVCVPTITSLRRLKMLWS